MRDTQNYISAKGELLLTLGQVMKWFFGVKLTGLGPI